MDFSVHKLSVTVLSLGGALSAFALVFTGAGTAAGQPSRDVVEGAGSAQVGPQPGRVQLHYELGPGAQSCDDEAFFRRMLRSELELPDPFQPTGPATHTLAVRIQRDAPGYRAIVKLITASGQEVYARNFLERSCSDAVDRAVIVAMIALFPVADDKPSPPPAPPPPAAPPSPVTRGEGGGPQEGLQERVAALEARVAAQERAIQSLTARLDSPSSQLHQEEKGTKKRMDIAWALSTGALMTANLTPNVAPGVWAEGEARTGPFSLAANLRVALPSEIVAKPHTFDQSEYTGYLVPCGHYLYFFGCGLIGLGFDISYDGDANPPKPPLTPITTTISHVFQAGGRLGGEVPFGDTRFGAKAWAEVLYTWPTLQIHYNEDVVPAWERPKVHAAFGLGLFIKLGGEGAN